MKQFLIICAVIASLQSSAQDTTWNITKRTKCDTTLNGFFKRLFGGPEYKTTNCREVNDTLSFTVTNPVKDGLMEMTEANIEGKTQVFKAVGCKYARMHLTIQQLNVWDYRQYTSAGLKVIPTIVWDKGGSDKKRKYCTDEVGYRKALTAMFEALKPYGLPEAIAIENEPLNPNYWDTSKITNPISRYFTTVNIACDVAHKYGVKVMDGGITYNPNKAYQQRYSVYLEMLSYTKADYANLHWYFGDAKKPFYMFTDQVAYIKAITGKPVCTHEYGMLENDAVYFRQAKAAMSGFAYRFYYNGLGNENRDVVPIYLNGKIVLQ